MSMTDADETGSPVPQTRASDIVPGQREPGPLTRFDAPATSMGAVGHRAEHDGRRDDRGTSTRGRRSSERAASGQAPVAMGHRQGRTRSDVAIATDPTA